MFSLADTLQIPVVVRKLKCIFYCSRYVFSQKSGYFWSSKIPVIVFDTSKVIQIRECKKFSVLEKSGILG